MGNVVGAQAVQVTGAFWWNDTKMCTPRGKFLKNGVWNAWELGIFGWEIGHFEWEIFGKCFWEIGDLPVWNRRPPIHGVELFSKTSRELVNILPGFGLSETSAEVVHLCSRHARPWPWGEPWNYQRHVMFSEHNPFSPRKLFSLSIFPYEYICMKFSINFILFPLPLVVMNAKQTRNSKFERIGRSELCSYYY